MKKLLVLALVLSTMMGCASRSVGAAQVSIHQDPVTREPVVDYRTRGEDRDIEMKLEVVRGEVTNIEYRVHRTDGVYNVQKLTAILNDKPYRLYEVPLRSKGLILSSYNFSDQRFWTNRAHAQVSAFLHDLAKEVRKNETAKVAFVAEQERRRTTTDTLVFGGNLPLLSMYLPTDEEMAMARMEWAVTPAVAFSHVYESTVSTPPGDHAHQEDICMADALYHEARGEIEEGILAVKDVILNRVKSDKWPNTVCGVVRQDSQFSFVKEDLPTNNPHRWMMMLEEAGGSRHSKYPNATHYFNPSKVNPSWAKKLKKLGTIGNHVFYK
jgi:spore germination cell wall hydrolase CwlJ-like protein